jgi:hypothetical protein
VEGEGTTEALERCTKLFARIVKKSVKSHLSQEKTVRFIVRTVLQSIKKAADQFGTPTVTLIPIRIKVTVGVP